jgi:hypothetical protein
MLGYVLAVRAASAVRYVRMDEKATFAMIGIVQTLVVLTSTLSNEAACGPLAGDVTTFLSIC